MLIINNAKAREVSADILTQNAIPAAHSPGLLDVTLQLPDKVEAATAVDGSGDEEERAAAEGGSAAGAKRTAAKL